MKSFLASAILSLVTASTFSVSTQAATLIAGSPKAKAQILVYGDLQCPFTKRFMETVDQLEAQYGNKIGVTFAHFPLDFHEHAKEAAEAAECARQYGHGKEFIRETFKTQAHIAEEFYFLNTAKEAGISDEEGFQACLGSPKAQAAVEADLASGQALGIMGTPYVWVNGKLFKGAYPTEDFKKEIDAALAPQK